MHIDKQRKAKYFLMYVGYFIRSGFYPICENILYIKKN